MTTLGAGTPTRPAAVRPYRALARVATVMPMNPASADRIAPLTYAIAPQGRP